MRKLHPNTVHYGTDSSIQQVGQNEEVLLTPSRPLRDRLANIIDSETGAYQRIGVRYRGDSRFAANERFPGPQSTDFNGEVRQWEHLLRVGE
jgi:hypothetical protein